MQRVLAQWDRFHKGLPTDDHVRPDILASWLRSRQAGVDPLSEGPRPRVPEADLQRRREANAGLLAVARPHLAWASTALGPLPHRITFTDRDGIVLEALGTPDGLDPDEPLLGRDLSERAVGTNGAGT